MNLHNVVQGYITAVNPPLLCTLQASTGYTTASDGKRVPTYATPVAIEVQCQALTYNDILQVSSLNIQGVRLAMYLTGNWNGVVRNDNKGGDLITLPDNTIWLAAMILENWSRSSGWTKICATQQVG
jgi:hypothetical protein